MIHTYFSEPPVPKPKKKSKNDKQKTILASSVSIFPGISVFFFKAIFSHV